MFGVIMQFNVHMLVQMFAIFFESDFDSRDLYLGNPPTTVVRDM
jgi:hypothetical protein